MYCVLCIVYCVEKRVNVVGRWEVPKSKSTTNRIGGEKERRSVFVPRLKLHHRPG